VVAADTLVKFGPPRSETVAKKKIVAAIDAAAARLNNTRAVSRKSYVNPRVPESYLDGTLDNAVRRARRRDRLSRSESAVVVVVTVRLPNTSSALVKPEIEGGSSRATDGHHGRMTDRAVATGLPERDEHLRDASTATDERPGQEPRDPHPASPN
jgi:hypothetical protein